MCSCSSEVINTHPTKSVNFKQYETSTVSIERLSWYMFINNKTSNERGKKVCKYREKENLKQDLSV